MPKRHREDPFFVDRHTVNDILTRVVRRDQPNLRRAAWGLGVLAAHRTVAAALSAGRRLDDLLYPDYAQRQIESPVFIVANPRSGTTFLHRLMSLDPQFFHLKLYHTLFPSVSIIQAIHALAMLDGPAGGALRKAVKLVERLAFGGWDDIHEIGFGRAEEDEALFVLNLLTPALYLLLHEIDEVQTPGYLDSAPRAVRDRIIRYYRDSVARIARAEDAQGRLLEKSVLIAGRFETMREVFPGTRFIHLVRHPYRSIPSFVSMFRSTWRAVSPDIRDDGPEIRRLTALGVDYYRRLHEASQRFDEHEMITVRFRELVGSPMRTLEEIYGWLGLDLTPSFRARVARELANPAKHKSKHEYSLEQFGIEPAFIHDQLADVFDAHGFEP